MTLHLMNLSKNDFIPVNTVQCYSVREKAERQSQYILKQIALSTRVSRNGVYTISGKVDDLFKTYITPPRCTVGTVG